VGQEGAAEHSGSWMSLRRRFRDRGWGDRAYWRFPGATCFVVTTFSPCPLAQEWQHRILRAPHDMGPLGNLSRRPPLTSGGPPGAVLGASDQGAMPPALSWHMTNPLLFACPPFYAVFQTVSGGLRWDTRGNHAGSDATPARRFAHRPVT